jgi:hypothetical protein
MLQGAMADLVVRHPVLELLARRAERADQATAPADGARLALAIEGGGDARRGLGWNDRCD